ncbi:hypothetical protein GGX14DRAFT_634203 [Mycena pura]|uniref:Uncharacterized protein n=1 Tax=Mycena pura TaxID=153505 RepID=A0AAD6VBD5_9AGAR|nr:hypothetical protein GGX14DRAFT_634203 [Mycena pura]
MTCCPICTGKVNPASLGSCTTWPRQPGDVVRATDMSVKLPLLAIMHAARTLRGQPLATFHSMNDPGSSWGRTRPAVVVAPPSRPSRGDSDSSWLCLLATFDKTPPHELPPTFQHLAVPVYPNLGHPRLHSRHIHTHPEWTETSAWIIAVPVRSRIPVACSIPPRWRVGGQPGGFRLAAGQTSLLRRICNENTARFTRSINSPSYCTLVLSDLRLVGFIFCLCRFRNNSRAFCLDRKTPTPSNSSSSSGAQRGTGSTNATSRPVQGLNRISGLVDYGSSSSSPVILLFTRMRYRSNYL